MVTVMEKKDPHLEVSEVSVCNIDVGRLVKGNVTGDIYIKTSAGLFNLSRTGSEMLTNDRSINGVVLPLETVIKYSYGN